MTASLDNFTIREALLARGFEDITSATRKTKSWRLQHPQMRHWVSIKQAADTGQPMETAPLVVHPDDATLLQAEPGPRDGITVKGPFNGGSAKYGGVAGHAVSLADLEAIDACVRLLISTGAAAGAASRPDSAGPLRQTDPHEQLAGYSATAFEEALLSCLDRVTPQQRAMLFGHARAPNQRLSMEAIALHGGYESYAAANSQYGRLGHLIADWFGISGLANWTQALATSSGETDTRGHFLWTLRPNLVAALRKAGWLDVEGTAVVSADQAAEELDAEGKARPATTRQVLIDARLGQGLFRERVLDLWQQRCAVTGCTLRCALVASHALPWKDSGDLARLDPYNGLPLAASIDKLFDKGLIAFDDAGRLLRKDGLADTDLAHLGLMPGARLRADCLHAKHLPYLAAHRDRNGF